MLSPGDWLSRDSSQRIKFYCGWAIAILQKQWLCRLVLPKSGLNYSRSNQKLKMSWGSWYNRATANVSYFHQIQSWMIRNMPTSSKTYFQSLKTLGMEKKYFWRNFRNWNSLFILDSIQFKAPINSKRYWLTLVKISIIWSCQNYLEVKFW